MVTKKHFASLCILSSTILATSTTLAQSASAQNPDSVVLDRVNVVGNPENIKDLTGSAQYISSEELDTYQYNDINRVLSQVPGVNIQEEEGYGNRPNIGLRGGRSERSADITLMEDGVLIAPAPYAAPSAYYVPRIDRMEGVEVRKGSSTIKFGPRTTSGAVNLVTAKIPNKSKAEGVVAYGEDDTQRLRVRYGNTIDNVGFLVDFGHEQTDGFKSIDIVGGDTGFSIQDAMLKLKLATDASADIYQSVELKLGATEEDSDETYLGLTDTDFGNDPFRRYAATQNDHMDADHQQYQLRHFIDFNTFDLTTTAYRNEFARNWYKLQDITVGGTKLSLANALDNATYLAALKGESNLDGSSTDNLRIRANNREYYAQGIQTDLGTEFKTGNAGHELQVGVRYHYDEEDRFQHEDLYSITSGKMTLTSAGAPGSHADRVGSAIATAAYIQDEISLGKWNIVPGVRYENVNLKRDNRASGAIVKNSIDAVVPGLGVGYQVNEQAYVFGGVHKGFAPPSPGSTVQEEEESVNYEAGVRYNVAGLQTEFVGFFNDYENLLGECTISSGCADGTGEQFNAGEVEVYGLEASVAYDLANLTGTKDFTIPLRANYTFTDAEFSTSFSSSFDEWGDVTSGDELPYIPEHQLYVSVGLGQDKWNVNLAGKFIDEMRTVAGTGAIPDGEGTDARIVFDLAGEYEVHKNARAFFTIDNVFDETYMAARRPAGARPGKPQTILAGLKVDF